MDIKIYSHQSSPDYVNTVVSINGKTKVFEGDPSKVKDAMQEYLSKIYFEDNQERRQKYDTSHMKVEERAYFRDMINKRITLKGDISHYESQIKRKQEKLEELVDHYEELTRQLQEAEKNLQVLLNPKQCNESQMHKLQEMVSNKATNTPIENEILNSSGSVAKDDNTSPFMSMEEVKAEEKKYQDIEEITDKFIYNAIRRFIYGNNS